MTFPRNPLPIAAALLAATCAVLIASGCSRRNNTAKDHEPTLARAEPLFVGNAACKECHEKAFETHSRSRHVSTLSLVSDPSSTELSPPVGKVADTRYSVSRAADGLYFKASGKPSLDRRIDLVFGSGKNGVSYVSVQGDSVDRLRYSYYPALHNWFLHPGEEKLDLYDPPNQQDGAEAQACIKCHSTKMKSASLIPEPQFMGVGCEACHGPGSEHIRAARARAKRDLRVERIQNWGATQIVDLCGKCHGANKQSTFLMLDTKNTQRFTTDALVQSRCFWQSGDKFSCLTCHDPHTNASQDESHYNRACIGCHGPSAQGISKGNPCPVNPKDKCTSCHMKSTKFYIASTIPTKMTDHYIRPPGQLKFTGQSASLP